MDNKDFTGSIFLTDLNDKLAILLPDPEVDGDDYADTAKYYEGD